MFIEIDRDATATVKDPENFRAFKIVAPDGPDRIETVRRALHGLAELEGDGHAWVAPAALARNPAVAGLPGWQSGFDAMVEKARPHGWVHPETGAVRAHIEWVE